MTFFNIYINEKLATKSKFSSLKKKSGLMICGAKTLFVYFCWIILQKLYFNIKKTSAFFLCSLMSLFKLKCFLTIFLNCMKIFNYFSCTTICKEKNKMMQWLNKLLQSTRVQIYFSIFNFVHGHMKMGCSRPLANFLKLP
jgi:hypothetical protein